MASGAFAAATFADGEQPSAKPAPKRESDDATAAQRPSTLYKTMYLRTNVRASSSAMSSSQHQSHHHTQRHDSPRAGSGTSAAAMQSMLRGGRCPRTASRRAYIARVADSVTLVVLMNADQAAHDDEREQLDAARDEFVASSLDGYDQFLAIRASTHVSMLPYAYEVPGLVHFIFIDRSQHRVLSPNVMPLHGQSCRVHTPETSQRMSELLREEVWRLVNYGQAAMARGSVSTVVRRGFHF